MLVDQLYEHRVRLMCSAACGPLDLFRDEDTGTADGGEGPTATVAEDRDPFGREIASNNVRVEELAAVQELDFAFQRASSRLVEMASHQYLSQRQHPALRQGP